MINKNSMKRVSTIALLFLLMLFSGKGYSQTAVQSRDTLRIRQQQAEQQNEQQRQEQREQQQVQQGSRQKQAQAGTGNAGGHANGQAGKAVKQVRGSRPDMSRARGARPPMIVRPSGSGVPKGVGKPGGAGRKGGR